MVAILNLKRYFAESFWFLRGVTFHIFSSVIIMSFKPLYHQGPIDYIQIIIDYFKTYIDRLKEKEMP